MNKDKQAIPVISFVAARSNTGKTTLLEKVIQELKKSGLKVAVIKHDVHEFSLDQPGKDTWRFAQAGADIVAISSPKQAAIIEKVEQEKRLTELVANISGVDLILTEGFKQESYPKIEVFRKELQQSLVCRKEELLAVVGDAKLPIEVPCYSFQDVAGLTQFIKNYIQQTK